MGHTPLSFRIALNNSGINCKFIDNLNDLNRELILSGGQTTLIFTVGNYGGKGRLITRWLETMRKKDDFRKIQEMPLFNVPEKTA